MCVPLYSFGHFWIYNCKKIVQRSLIEISCLLRLYFLYLNIKGEKKNLVTFLEQCWIHWICCNSAPNSDPESGPVPEPRPEPEPRPVHSNSPERPPLFDWQSYPRPQEPGFQIRIPESVHHKQSSTGILKTWFSRF